jgi:ABC-2 type transport system permease protein
MRRIREFFVRIGRIFVRTSSFLMMEIVEILRQPRLILTLVLGPFLILLLFGLGYRGQARPLRALFVVPDNNSALRQQVEEYAKSLGPQLIYEGVTSDQNVARAQLRNQQIDVIVVPPENIDQTLNNNQQAVIKLYHNEIDPIQADYVAVFGRIYTDEMNRRVLQAVTQEGQTEFKGVSGDLADGRTSLKAVRTATEAGDRATAQREAGRLDNSLSNLEAVAVTGIGLLAGAGDMAGSQQNADVQDTARLLAEMRQDTQAVNANKADSSTLDRMDRDMGLLEERMKQFENVDPAVLVSPFVSKTENIAPVQVDVTDFYAPAVIVLLLQHLCITFAALSVVRDRRSGAMELFRVSPLAAAEMLIGKYLSYFLFAGVLGAILTAILVYVLRVPMLDWWQNYALAVAALIFASLGAGFVISLISDTTTQAVQYSMLLLLASVFFTGFFLRLDNLLAPVRLISWLLPATYGIQLLQNIMLRGRGVDVGMISALAAIGVFLMIVAWTQLRKVMAYE